jgi:hypothetical protein
LHISVLKVRLGQIAKAGRIKKACQHSITKNVLHVCTEIMQTCHVLIGTGNRTLILFI